MNFYIVFQKIGDQTEYICFELLIRTLPLLALFVGEIESGRSFIKRLLFHLIFNGKLVLSGRKGPKRKRTGLFAYNCSGNYICDKNDYLPVDGLSSNLDLKRLEPSLGRTLSTQTWYICTQVRNSGL